MGFTLRLVLRPFRDEDAPALLAQWNDPKVRRYLFDDLPVPPEGVAEQIALSQQTFTSHGFGYFTVALRTEPEATIGFCGLRTFGTPARVEILYALLPGHWGHGYATEASEAVLSLAFDGLGLPEVWAGGDPPNVTSFGVMERLGMTFAEELIIGGPPARYYRLSREQWRTRDRPQPRSMG